ncbi:hypothetical protein BKA70DRAFT_1323674 [Coprinopsis sp. MPI-PUGE-AT-0042]|nr:hypothetical protein BKA70DRAFT_1323674 [Coprinopsis sp. MPI-PUGE-AT-0042]
MARYSFSQISAGIAITLLSIPRLVAGQRPKGYLASPEDLEKWIAETDATVNYIGPGRISPINPFEVRIIWCSERRGDVCGGECTVYTGGGDQCMRTMQSTACLASTSNIRFCATDTCEPACNLYDECGVHMDSGFCVTPHTSSIQIVTTGGEDDTPPSPGFETSSPSSLTFAQPTPTNPQTHIPPLPSSPAATGAAAQPGESGSSENSGALPVSAIAGIVLGVLFMLGASICAVLWLRYKTRRLSMVTHTPPPPRSPPQHNMPVSSPPMHSLYTTNDPPMHQYQRSPTTDYDMESMYTSNPGYPVTMSSMSYASAPSVAPKPPPVPGMPSSAGAKGHDRALRPVNRDEEGDDDDSRSFGHYLVHSDSGYTPHRVDSAEVRPHYTQ